VRKPPTPQENGRRETENASPAHPENAGAARSRERCAQTGVPSLMFLWRPFTSHTRKRETSRGVTSALGAGSIGLKIGRGGSSRLRRSPPNPSSQLAASRPPEPRDVRSFWTARPPELRSILPMLPAPDRQRRASAEQTSGRRSYRQCLAPSALHSPSAGRARRAAGRPCCGWSSPVAHSRGCSSKVASNVPSLARVVQPSA
jgi:hypothetical protein